jgi:predicted nucleotidyltransferase
VPVPETLPESVRAALASFSSAAQQTLGDDLVALVLFGSAADGRLRSTSDVNLVVVMARCEPERLAALGDAYRLTQAAIRLSAMFILESEIGAAADAFAVKFGDIAMRHVILYGRDVFGGLAVSRAASLYRVRQVLMNLLLRLRERYVAESLSLERLALVAADAVGPLRASAATLLQLRDDATVAPREALRLLTAETGKSEALASINEAREAGSAAAGGGAAALLAAIDLAATLGALATSLA